MDITIYKNCIITDRYDVVFSKCQRNNSSQIVLDEYLGSLHAVLFQLENVYYETNGTLVFDDVIVPQYFANDIHDYNYLKVEYSIGTNRKITRYCFVKSISHKNGCVYLEYEEDVWHSYSDKIKFGMPCTLSGSRAKSYGQNFNFEFMELPVKYDGNKRLDLIYDFNEQNAYGCIVLELQTYDLTTATQSANRDTCYVIVGVKDENDNIVKTFRIVQLYRYLLRILNYVTRGKLNVFNEDTQTTSQKYYCIGDIYCFPAIFSIQNYANTDTIHATSVYGISYITTNSHFVFCRFALGAALGTYIPVYTHTITNNFKNLSYGTFTNQQKIINNGNDTEIKVSFCYDISNVSLRLEMQNQVFDITEDFYCQMPYTPLDAAQFAQRKIALQIQNANLDAQAYKSGLNIGASLFGSLTSQGQQLLNQANYGQKSLGQSRITSNYLSSAFGGIADVVNISKVKDLINSPVYSNSQAYWGNSKTFVNFFIPLVLCRINPSNANFVKSYVDFVGFDTYKFIYGNQLPSLFEQDVFNYLYYNLEMNYNCMRFDNPDVSGEFTAEIAHKLNTILAKGFVIYYNPYLLDDSYTDDLLS